MISAATVRLGVIAGWFLLSAVQLPASPSAFFSCVNTRKELSSPGKPWWQVHSKSCQYLLHPHQAQGAADVGR